ncbi:MAG TPA: inorganic diphosphatase [Egibacteraceae bacterium]|nr:inorganic diphosphatase [Egibacteraceae bacterium]
MTVDLEKLPLGDDAPRVVNVVVEVPVGSRNKYEYDSQLGVIVRDRVLPGSVRYPMDYGFAPSTVADDGDPLDILLAAYDPAFPGCVVRARTIGVLDMHDVKGPDPKIFAVPDDDPRFADIGAVADVPAQNLREIEQFLRVYKELEGDEDVEIRGWLGPGEAHELIRSAARR